MLARQEMTVEGDTIRRLYDLPMTRSRSAMFALSWTAVHQIVEGSPLFGATSESLANSAAEIIVSIIGLDETFSQTVHARHTYELDEIVWGARFADVLVLHPDGSRSVDYTRFDDVEMLTSCQVTRHGACSHRSANLCIINVRAAGIPRAGGEIE